MKLLISEIPAPADGMIAALLSERMVRHAPALSSSPTGYAIEKRATRVPAVPDRKPNIRNDGAQP